LHSNHIEVIGFKAWAQGVRANSTFIILHSGNYEFVCFRHRGSQKLYVSDILLVKNLSRPGYGKLQIGIYMATLDDAFRRLALDKVGDSTGSEHDEDSDSMDEDEDESQEADKRPPKRRKASHIKDVSEVDSVCLPCLRLIFQIQADTYIWILLKFMLWSIIEQVSSRHVLLLHMHYDIYDTVHPAIFYRGARINLDNEGLLSPPVTPATSFPIDARILLFLTSDCGEDASGVLHDGILELEWDEKNSSTIAVTTKLAFTDKHQENLVQEWSVHMHMLSESVEGIQTILGVYHEDEDEGPSCLVSYQAGTSLADKKLTLSPDQRYVLSCRPCAIASTVLQGVILGQFAHNSQGRSAARQPGSQ
jgi:hypothetical protein